LQGGKKGAGLFELIDNAGDLYAPDPVSVVRLP
jgi:hypothetical protein